MSLPSRIALGVALIAALLLLVSGPGVRLELWEFRTGFLLMRWAVYVGVAAAGLGLLALLVPAWRRAGATPALMALVLGLATAYVPWSQLQNARAKPPIHDITTDTSNPPDFVALLPARLAAPNGAQYAGEDVASQQREAYPDLVPLRLAQPPAQVFQRAVALVEQKGWELVDADPDQGRIEATATTFWYGFKDDVVLRIVADPAGSRVDMRSMSRLGRGDAGANAARIEGFLAKLQQ